jgi:hypothetical protein
MVTIYLFIFIIKMVQQVITIFQKKKIFLQSKPGTMGSNFCFFDTLCNFFYTLGTSSTASNNFPKKKITDQAWHHRRQFLFLLYILKCVQNENKPLQLHGVLLPRMLIGNKKNRVFDFFTKSVPCTSLVFRSPGPVPVQKSSRTESQSHK